MPIATPEVYAEMLDRAKAGAFAYPAINVTSSQTLNAALRGLRRRRQRRHRPGLHRRRGVPVRPDRQGHGDRGGRLRRVRARGRQEVPGQRSRCTPTTARRTSSTLRPPAAGDLQERVDRGEQPLFQSHMWDGSAVPLDENLRDRRASCSAQAAAAKIILEIEVGVVGGEEDGVVGAIDEKLYTTAEDGLADRRGARCRREGPLPGRAHVRQRARRLQAGQRQAPPGDPQGDPGRGRRQVRQGASRSTSSSTAARARCWRRSARRSTTAW